MPDGKLIVEDIVAEGDKVAIRLSGSGSHKGQWLGIPPTDKKVKISQHGIFRIADGKLVEFWDGWNDLHVLRQIGGLPATGEGGD